MSNESMAPVSSARTLFEKLWSQHVVMQLHSRALLYIDCHWIHDGSFTAFGKLQERGYPVRVPQRTFGTTDHYISTNGARVPPLADPELSRIAELVQANASRYDIPLLGPTDARQGIVHVVAPELGATLPGTTIVCGDSHTSTHGAFGALGFGIGASEVVHVLATQCVWQRKPRVLAVEVSGSLGPFVSAKDLGLAIIARIGSAGGTGHVIEYRGETIRALPMEGRMTLCNMAIEAGARTGLIAPDETTFEYLAGRPWAPQGARWDAALADWRALPSDPGATFDQVVHIDAARLAPTVTWGTSPEQALPVDDVVPDPSTVGSGERSKIEQALAYMDLRPGTALEEVPIDRVFIGSCTNGRIEDLRLAARVLAGRRATVPGFVSPGSSAVKAQAEAEGLHRVFRDAGLEWRDSGCSMCVGMNGDLAQQRERVASTSNRNFANRQGPQVRTHLMSPAMAAAAAVTGRLTDVRKLVNA
jgi:3-isopropylmalate/(R)-2-methylmalate dehydratase large subunit